MTATKTAAHPTRAATGPFPEGFAHHALYFGAGQQRALLEAVADIARAAPFYRPAMPRSGQPLSVRMTNCGPLGWISDQQGYRYEPRHPVTGAPWPPMPRALLDLWAAVTHWPAPPQACLVNWYGEGARLGLHVDADEDARDAPVVSVSLGDDALFRLGGPARRDATRPLWLTSGDVVVLAGAARRCFHGVDRIRFGSSALLSSVDGFSTGGRINLTLRRVTAG
jgi:alkylated DNA repair protein (DNA oxidative demethylase)